jgi:chromosome segregation ATPase
MDECPFAEIEHLRSRVAELEAEAMRMEAHAKVFAARLAEAELNLAEIPTLCRRYEARLADAEERHYRYVKGVGELADRAARVSEIIAYCAQEGHDGEPYDTINAIAAGEYSTRGGGR